MQHRPYNSAALNEFNIDNFAGNWIAGFTDVGEGTFPEKRWQNIVQFDTGHFENQISMQSSFGNGYLPEIHLRSKYAGGENQSWTNWNKIVTNSDLQWEVVTHNTEPSNHQVDGKTLFKVEYTANKQIVGFAPMQPNLIIHGIYRNSAEIDYLIVTNSSGENIPNIEINVKVLFANFS